MKPFAQFDSRIFSVGVTIRKTPLIRDYTYEFNVQVAWFMLGLRFKKRKSNGSWI